MNVPEPMYASIADAMPAGRDWTFEQKYDGMRVVAAVSSRGAKLVTRNGRDKSAQFPEIAAALRALATRRKRSLILDGEIVALVRGKPAAFQALQGRLHRASEIDEMILRAPAAIVLFDILRDGRSNLMRLPLADRREHLEAVISGTRDDRIRLSDGSISGPRMIARARR